MIKSHSSVYIIWSIAIIVVCAIIVIQIEVHKFSRASQFATKIVMNGKIKRNFESYDNKLLLDIEQQLQCAQTDNFDWVKEFKKDSTSYPRNVFEYSVKYMMKTRSFTNIIMVADSTLEIEIAMNDTKPFKVLFQFIQIGDSAALISVENLCPLFKKINCYKKYERSNIQ